MLSDSGLHIPIGGQMAIAHLDKCVDIRARAQKRVNARVVGVLNAQFVKERTVHFGRSWKVLEGRREGRLEAMWGIDRYGTAAPHQLAKKITEYSIFSHKITINRKIKTQIFSSQKINFSKPQK